MKHFMLAVISALCCPVLLGEPQFEKLSFPDNHELMLTEPLRGTWSISCNFCVSDYPDGGAGLFDDNSPLSLFHVFRQNNETSILVRLYKRKLETVVFHANKVLKIMSGVEFALEHETCQALITVNNGQLKGYLNGRLQFKIAHDVLKQPYTRIVEGRFGNRRVFRGVLEHFCRWNCALETDAVVAQCPEEIRLRPVHALTLTNNYDRYPVLHVVPDGLHAWHDMHDVMVTPIAWHDPHGRDLLVHSPCDGLLGTRIALFRFLGLDKATGLPVYDTGKTLINLPGGRYRVLKHPDGSQELIATGYNTMYGTGSLVSMAVKGQGDSMTFGEPVEIPFGDDSMEVPGSWCLCDVRGDGTPDLFFITSYLSGSGYPYGENPWQHKEMTHIGKGRGYDIDGNWLGTQGIYGVKVARGHRDAQGRLSFGTPEIVMYRLPDYPLEWKTWGMTALNALCHDGIVTLLLQGNADEIRCVDLHEQDGRYVGDNARYFLADKASMQNSIYCRSMSVVDIDLDGYPEVIADGNLGRLAVLKGKQCGDYREVGCALMKGGAIACDTLVSPARVDWTQDGRPDIVTGDAAGRLLLWGGTDSLLEYLPAKPFTVNGKAVIHQAGPGGSIQGHGERRWGYTKPTVFDWDGDGLPELIVNDIRGDMVYYHRADGDDPLALRPSQPFTWRGEKLPVAWRARPDVVPASRHVFGCNMNVLLFLDWDGDAAVGIPEASGSTVLARVEKLRSRDGSSVRLCGPAGLWGRCAMSVVDFDDNGVWDIVFGTNGSCHPDIQRPGAPLTSNQAMPVLLRNIGTNEQPLFDDPRPITLKDGTQFRFHTHCATPWFTDLTGDGRGCDMLIGGEDGKIYYFYRRDIVCGTGLR